MLVSILEVSRYGKGYWYGLAGGLGAGAPQKKVYVYGIGKG